MPTILKSDAHGNSNMIDPGGVKAAGDLWLSMTAHGSPPPGFVQVGSFVQPGIGIGFRLVYDNLVGGETPHSYGTAALHNSALFSEIAGPHDAEVETGVVGGYFGHGLNPIQATITVPMTGPHLIVMCFDHDNGSMSTTGAHAGWNMIDWGYHPAEKRYTIVWRLVADGGVYTGGYTNNTWGFSAGIGASFPLGLAEAVPTFDAVFVGTGA